MLAVKKLFMRLRIARVTLRVIQTSWLRLISAGRIWFGGIRMFLAIEVGIRSVEEVVSQSRGGGYEEWQQ